MDLADELADVCARAGATVVGEIDWKRPVWTVDVSGHPAVLHRHARHRDHDDVVWELDALDRLADAHPCVARPVRAFHGVSAVVAAHGAVWTLQDRLPGVAMGWGGTRIGEAGAFLARFHQATRALDLGRRPTQPPPARLVVAELPWDEIERRIGAARSDWFRSLGERLTSRLAEAGVFDRPTGPLHGDITVFNVLVDDDGRPSGLVDFALATADVQVLDLAYAGWSWSRTSFVAEELDTGRLQQLVRGYHRVEPMPDAADWLPDAILCRAFQLVARWLPRRPEQDLTPTLTRLAHLEQRRDELASAVASAVA